MIKNIVFDIGNVLVKGRCSSILNKMSCSEQEKEIINNTFMSNYSELDLGKMTIGQYIEKCNMPKEIVEKYGDILRGYYKYRDLNYDLLKLIPRLKQHGYNIYYLSDNNKEAFNYWLNLPEFSCVDGYVVSCDYQCVKASRKLFEIFLSKYNLNPKECLFIDDRSINIEIARKLGFKCILYASDSDNFFDLISYIRKQNIKL